MHIRRLSLIVDMFVGGNYNYWKLFMEAYLHDQYLWDLIFGVETVILDDTSQNGELCWTRNIKCDRALFSLRTSIGKDYIDHAHNKDMPKLVWETLERLFTPKNTMVRYISKMNFLEWHKVICQFRLSFESLKYLWRNFTVRCGGFR